MNPYKRNFSTHPWIGQEKRPVISKDESVMIKDHIKYVTKHWFAMSIENMTNFMYELIPADGGTSAPTMYGLRMMLFDTIESFIGITLTGTLRTNTLRKFMQKFMTTFPALRKCFEMSGMTSLEFFWSFTDCVNLMRLRCHVNGKKKNVFGAEDTNHGWYAPCHASKKNKHIHAIVAIFSLKSKDPSFFYCCWRQCHVFLAGTTY